MNEKNMDAGLERFKDFLQKHRAALSSSQELVKPLASVLERDGSCEIPLDSSIFTNVTSGVIFHAPVPLKEEVTRRDLETRAHFVGVLANTVPLMDPVTRRALEPGSYAVQLRPLLRGGFAFDFVNEKNTVSLSTSARSTDPGKYETFPEETPALQMFKSLVDSSIWEICFGEVIMEPIGSGPTFPDSPFSDQTWECTTLLCVSFLGWDACIEIPTVAVQ